MRLPAAAAVACFLIAAPATASPYPQANDYFKVRDAGKIVTSFAHEDLVLSPAKFDGYLLEIRGLISGLAGADDHLTLLVNPGQGLAPHAVSVPTSARTPALSFLTPDNRVRLLCRVVSPEGATGGRLEVVTAVKEHEAVSIDNARTQERLRQAASRRSGIPTRMASRGSRPSAATGTGGALLSRQQYISAYADAVQYFNRRLSRDRAETIAAAILENSIRNQLDPRLVMAVVACESNFNENAVSRVGARGLGQLMPGTAADLGVNDSFDLHQNLDGSTRLLKSHISKMSRSGEVTEEAVRLALACYNAGAGAVKKHGGIPPYRETRNYVKKVTALYRRFCGN